MVTGCSAFPAWGFGDAPATIELLPPALAVWPTEALKLYSTPGPALALLYIEQPVGTSFRPDGTSK
jgi:hypothetical protein